MSNKLVRKKKNKPKYGWMQSEIDAAVRRDAYDKHVAGYAVTMMQHVLESDYGRCMINSDLVGNDWKGCREFLTST